MNNLLLEVLYKNELTCPQCNNKQKVEMLSLDNARFYRCDCCHEIIQVSNNKCCVYCEYGIVKCPLEQAKIN